MVGRVSSAPVADDPPGSATGSEASSASGEEGSSGGSSAEQTTRSAEGSAGTAAGQSAGSAAGEGQSSSGGSGVSEAARSASGRGRTSISLAIIAALGVLYSLYFARAVLMPLVMACMFTLLLRPIIRRAHRYRIPESVSAAGVLLSLLVVLGAIAAHVAIPARDWINNAPAHMQVVGEKLSVVREHFEEISKVSDKMRELAEADDGEGDDEQDGEGKELADGESESIITRTIEAWSGDSEGSELAADRPIPVEVRQPRLLTGIAVLSTTGGVIGSVIVTMVLSYFLLTAGDRLLNHALQLMPTFRDRRNTVEMIYEVEHGISAYLLTISLINVGLGLVIAAALWVLGVPNPLLWGAMACLLNFIPYLGAMVGTVIVFLVAVYYFDSLAYAAVVPVVYLLITSLEGNLVTPALLGRRMSLNPVVVFLFLIFWGWMWGVGGALLAVPILAVVKIALEQFERTQPVSLLLEG